MKNSLGLSIFAMVLMLVGLVVLPVSAAFVPITNEMTEQSFDADDDGLSFVFENGVGEDVGGGDFYFTIDNDFVVKRQTYKV